MHSIQDLQAESSELSSNRLDNSGLYNNRLHSPLHNHSQSALEYMMTYGWAILVIVIVAAVLYSMGIFTPSSFTPATVTGLSGFQGATADVYQNTGMSIASSGTPHQSIFLDIWDTLIQPFNWLNQPFEWGGFYSPHTYYLLSWAILNPFTETFALQNTYINPNVVSKEIRNI